MYAHLTAYEPNGRGQSSQASVEYNDVIELTINNRKYRFDNEGNLLNQTQIMSCVTQSPKICCSQPRTEISCYSVIKTISED
jgi:hypothetical protein